MADNSFNNTVESLFKGMDSFITTKTVVGDAIHIGDTIILPLVDVSFGVAAGAFSQEKKNNGAGGMGGKINPSAVLVIQNGQTKLVNIKNQDGMTKILDMVPDIVNKFTSGVFRDTSVDFVSIESFGSSLFRNFSSPLFSSTVAASDPLVSILFLSNAFSTIFVVSLSSSSPLDSSDSFVSFSSRERFLRNPKIRRYICCVSVISIRN